MVSISVINTHVQFRIRLFTYDLQEQNYNKRKEKKKYRINKREPKTFQEKIT